jgi:hypothetical protein
MYQWNIVLELLPYPNRSNNVRDVRVRLPADNQCSTRVVMATGDSNKDRH